MKVDIVLQDINAANAERMHAHYDKLEAQRQLNELTTKYDDLVKRLEAREAQPKPRQAARHNSYSTLTQRRVVNLGVPLFPQELQGAGAAPQPVRVEEQVAESRRQDMLISSFSCRHAYRPKILPASSWQD